MSECQNPVTPDLTRTKPVVNENCVTDSRKILVPGSSGGNGKTINISPSTSNVTVDTLRGTLEDNFFIGVPVYVEPTINLSITSPTGIQLNGTTVTSVALSWTFNKSMQSQLIYIDNVLVASPTINDNGNNSFSATLSGLSITADTVFKVVGNDGTKNVQDTETVRFGEYLVWAEGVFLDSNSSNTAIQAVLESGNNIGPLASRSYGSPFIQPQSIDPDDYFYIAIAVSEDNLSIDPLDKFYEHDGDDKGGGMFLMKQNVPLDLGQGDVNYNIYRALFGAQGGAKYEVI